MAKNFYSFEKRQQELKKKKKREDKMKKRQEKKLASLQADENQEENPEPDSENRE